MAKPVAVAQIASNSTQNIDIAYATWNGTTTVSLTGANSTVTSPASAIASYQWVLLQKPTGSSAALSSATVANPILNSVETAGTYRLMLIVTDNNAGGAETSENDILKAPTTAFVNIHATTRYLALTKAATGERDWTSGYHGVVDALDTLKNTVTTGGIPTATTSVLGKIKLSETPVDGANPKATTTDRGSFLCNILGTFRATAGGGLEFLPTIGVAASDNTGSKFLFGAYIDTNPLSRVEFTSAAIAMQCAGNGGSNYRFDFAVVSPAEYVANDPSSLTAGFSVTVAANGSVLNGPSTGLATMPGTLPLGTEGKFLVCWLAVAPTILGSGASVTVNWKIAY